ncbi:RHS repeat domain-containing protein [Streptacidiphilus fuscans]|uniref:RHS repeat-associated core domain-containing protein n=1 Tax=Streptacidiphilus fuscans TaxID=2789292 RepID=A0A931BA23_9ACTN|nr:RHS repeat-associated core domain-containing protein [Streptacidiphilus fuscans]MBF9073904.1 RHS repeat-associated core domain-containing protein [Streptacidiphilus fuscans]
MSFLPDMAFAAQYAKGQVWSPPQTPLAPAKGVPRADATSVKSHQVVPTVRPYRAPAVDLPKAGQTTTALGAAGAVAPLAKSRVVTGTASRVGTSPLWVAAAATGSAAPSGVQVRFADPAAARKGGITSGLMFGVARGDRAGTDGKVAVQLDPSLLTGEGGGNLGSRLHLVELPACALTTPQLAACQKQTPVDAVRDPHTGRIIADLTLPATPAAPTTTTSAAAGTAGATGDRPSAAGTRTTAAVVSPMTVLAAVAGPSGSTGTYTATSLKPSDQWSAGGSTGDFEYSYPIQVPGTLGGAAPTVSLGYSSSSVDGENASTNTQTSGVGDGWSSPSDFIERSYQPCSQDGLSSSGDTCWGFGGNELTATGQNAGQIVYDDSTKTYHLSGDSGATISYLTNLNNGAYKGEGWEITLQDGTRMYYGAGKLPTAEGGTGSDPATNSVSTEPVYCPKSGDSCYSSTTGTSSYATNMAYRWYLDFVVDPHGNTTEYNYTQETNYYARSSAHTLTAYDRAAYLNTIEYGWRTSDIVSEGAKPAPAAKVVFTPANRCIVGSVINTHTVSSTDCASLTSTSAPYWPDVPQDQVCASTGTCTNYAMSFFSTVRLTQIQTQVNTGTTGTTNYKPVDTYALSQSYPDPGDGTTPALRLESVTRTGNDGGTTPPLTVSFTHAAMPNRAPGAASYPAFNRYRITAIDTESGEAIDVTYSAPDCNQSTTSPDLPAPSNDTRLCYQEYWTPPTGSTISDWFEKYVVTQVVDNDQVGGAPARYTTYTYNGTPAWHRNDSPLVANNQRTWDQFRGYGSVTTETGHAPDPITESTTSYLRGMSGDSTSQSSMTPRTWPAVTDSIGDQITDSNQYAGMAYETQTYNQAGGKVVKDDITLPWSQQTATHAESTPAGLPSETANFVRTASTVSRGLMSDGSTWRTTKTVNTYSPTTGLLTEADNQGDTSLLNGSSSQESCTTYSYATPPTSGLNTGMVSLPAETTTVALTSGTGVGNAACPAKTAANTTSDTRNFYDGSTTPGVIPTAGVGNITETDTLGSWSGTTENFTKKTTSPSGTTGYDVYGRQLSATDVRGDTVTTAYTPATGTLPTSDTATNVTAGNWTTTTTLDQLRQLPAKVVDPNGNSTSKAYDALGRLTSVWLPNRATSATASEVFVYSVGGQTAPTWTEAKTLRDDGTYAVDYQIENGFGDLRQDQTLSKDSANSNGALVSDDFYDSHGWKVKTTSTPYYVTSAPSSTIYPAADATVPGQTVTTYDGMGRAVQSAFYSYSAEQWATTTAYPGVDRTDVSRPTGGTATSTVTDAQGRTTALWTYHSNTATGNQADATVTSYAYTRTTASGGAATENTITDASGHTRTQTADANGNQVASQDPDAGNSSSTFDAAGDLLTSTDANNTTLTYSYDTLGRKTTLYQGTTELDSWSYDTATGGKGQLASQTSYSSGNAYTQTIAGYTNLGSSTGVSTVIPASEGSLAGTYSVSYAYTPVEGLLSQTTYGADGGLPAETVYNSYTEGGQLGAVGGQIGTNSVDYLTQIVSNTLGQVTRYTMGDMPDQVVQTDVYDTATDRVTESILDKENGTGHVDDNTTLWNQAGKVTAQQDVQDNSAATDLQCYTYNGQDQLTAAWTDTGGATSAASPSVPGIGSCNSTAPSASTNGGPAPYWESYSYDADGNRTGLTTHDTTGATTSTQTSAYPPGASGTTGTPDQAQTTTTTNSTGATTASSAYTYFGNGATKTDTTTNGGGTTTSSQTFTYTPDNHTSTVTDTTTGNSSGYIYDAAGNLLEQKDTVSSHTTTQLYLPGEQLTLNGGITALRYYTTGGGPVAVRDNTGNITYEAANAQGTCTVTLNSTLTVETRHSYTPYGTPRGVISPTLDGRGYLNEPADPATTYDLLGARTYDPTTGRFLQADPLLEVADPNQLGGYTYSSDDPVNGSDPNGLMYNGGDGPPPNCGYDCGDGAPAPTTPPPNPCGPAGCYGSGNTNTSSGNGNGSPVPGHQPAPQRPQCNTIQCLYSWLLTGRPAAAGVSANTSPCSGSGNYIEGDIAPSCNVADYLKAGTPSWLTGLPGCIMVSCGSSYNFWAHISVSFSMCLVACVGVSYQDNYLTFGVSGGIGTVQKPTYPVGTSPFGKLKAFAGLSVDYVSATPDDQDYQIAGVSAARGYYGLNGGVGKRNSGGLYYFGGYTVGAGYSIQGPTTSYFQLSPHGWFLGPLGCQSCGGNW